MRALIVSETALDPANSQLRNVLRAKVDPQGPAVSDFHEAERRLSQSQAEMVVVVLLPDAEPGLEVIRNLRRLTSSQLIAMGQASEPKLILRALQAGADYYLDESDLEAGLDGILERLQSKGEGPTPEGRLLALLAAGGGCGVSTLAVNLAVTLAKDQPPCALIDLKPGRGDLAALLDLKPQFTLADLCLNLARVDQSMFEKVLVPHDSGVHLLGAPQMFGDTRIVTAQGVHQVLALACRLYRHVVVDLEDCFHEEQQIVLKQATAVLLVVRLDFTSLRNARRIMDYLKELGIPPHRLRLVANRHGQPSELPVEEAEEALGTELFHCVPDDPRTINKANNMGVPAVLKSPSAKVSQSIVTLARRALDRRRHGPSGILRSAVAKLFSI